MKKTAVIGSPDLHRNYQTALEKAGCSAVIFPDASYVKKHPEAFDGLLLPGGGDVLSSFSAYLPFLGDAHPRCREQDETASRFAGLLRKSSGGRLHSNASLSRNTSPRSSTADFQLTLEQFRALHLFYELKKPVFGICKGMQLINLYFGGTIIEVSNPRLHRHPKEDVFHPAANLPGHFLHALFGPNMLVNSSHHQCIGLPGRDLQIMQHACDGTAEALSHISAPVFGTQWHPERMPDNPHQDALLLFRYFVSLL